MKVPVEYEKGCEFYLEVGYIKFEMNSSSFTEDVPGNELDMGKKQNEEGNMKIKI